jgi:DNA-binding response OmpR family regulator
MSSRKRVLVLEDHDDSRELLAAVLRGSGFDVHCYDRCAAAEPHLAAGDIDIALLDVRMPQRCGDDFARELRERCPQTMIVFITGEDAIDRLKACVPGCFVLRKPFDVAVLLELLDRFSSGRGYGSPVRKERKETADRAGPGEV